MHQTTKNRTFTLALTGASGAPYGLRLLECLLAAGCDVNLLISKAGQMVLAMESELTLSATIPARTTEIQTFFTEYFNANSSQLKVYGRADWMAPIASGSGASDAMIVCPCTSGSLSAIATGSSDNLIERAADVMIKEQKQLIIVLRETPLSVIHLENMLKLARLGVTIMPANPGFYQQPKHISDLVDFMVARILDHLAVEKALMPRWGQGQ